MSQIELTHKSPSHGWLIMQLTVDGQTTEIDASDVPNNPIHELANAIELAADGEPSSVWWNMEPDGYFMWFIPIGDEIMFRLDFAIDSNPHGARTIITTKGSREKVLMPFWRFLREFQSHEYTEPHWPATDFSRIQSVKARIVRTNGP